MNPRISSLALSTTILTLAMAFVAGCGPAEVAKADVEQVAMKQLTASVGKEAPPITCPGNLEAKVGATLVCAIDLDGKTFDVNVKVTAVEGEKTSFDIAVAKEPRP